MRKTICIVTVCFIILTMFSGCGVLQKLGLKGDDNDELYPVSSIVMNEDEAKKLTDKVPVRLYFANEDNTKLRIEIRYIDMTEAKKSPNNLASVIVKELIKGPGPKSSLKPTIPAGTQLRSPVNINARVATVDLTKEFVDKHSGEKAAEQMTIFSIVNSLTELKDIEKVRFLINGKAQKEFKGNFQFDAPFPRSTALISKDPVVPDSSVTSDLKDSKKDDAKDKEKDTDNKSGDGEKETSGDVEENAEDTYIELDDEGELLE